MTTSTLDSQKRYDPNRLMDALIDILQLDSDMALSQALEVPPLVISYIRYRNYPVAPSILIRMHDITRLSIQELRDIMGDRRKTVRTSYDMVLLGDGDAPDQREEALHASQNERMFYLFMVAGLLYVAWYFILH
ncbi:hypothetical protein [Noviherbaspirillum denitrificans]|uniref:hypothetical protein n=1 Tax=Noviherbaspirillum denitrificans TaxID=1968433 RepID=UPI000B532C76|nr:hypothetical protein [Noviherbaspirillum denitrificans]